MKSAATSTLDEFIMVINDGVSPTLSKRILDEYANCAHWKPATVESGRSAPNVRNCDHLDVTHPDTVAGNPLREELITQVTVLSGQWARAYEKTYVSIGLSERVGLGMARYGVGGYYRQHHDNHTDEVRTISMIAVLDTEFEGGELSFFDGEHVLDLAPGQVCLFPATFQYPHEVKPVLSGTRYSLISWLR